MDTANDEIPIEAYFSGSSAVLDPTLRAHIASLVSALGGKDLADGGKYALGDDGLACLKDIKQWLKGYDEKLNRFDVSRCLAESNIVNNDLLEILALWKDEDTNDKAKARVALACIEILVPLLWPIQLNSQSSSNNQARHAPFLRCYQLTAKSDILTHPSCSSIRAIIRVALPYVAKHRREREVRDEAIIKLVLYLLRNIAAIEGNSGLEGIASRSQTIFAFHEQLAFDFITTLAAQSTTEFPNQDLIILEILYYILRGINVDELFDDSQGPALQELHNLMQTEKEMRRGGAKHAASRHSRFGTMIAVVDGDRRLTVSSQEALLAQQKTVDKIDAAKKWKRPAFRARTREEDPSKITKINTQARATLCTFVVEFLEAAFNPLFLSIRKAFEREDSRVLDIHKSHYLYLIGFFLEADRHRRKRAASNNDDATDFGLVAEVLNHNALVIVTKSIRVAYELNHFPEVQSGMLCLQQILLTIRDMSISPSEEDQEIAENTQSRLFYEESTLLLLVSIVKSFHSQSIGYLDACTSLAHTLLKTLERFSKSDAHIFIKSRRRRRKAKNAATNKTPDENGDSEDEEDHLNVANDRAFEFDRFEREFLNSHCVDTFKALLDNWKELRYDQVKRVIFFFHRVFVKRKAEIILFRIDLCELFNRILHDDKPIEARKEFREFVKYFTKRLVRKLQDQPVLWVELLFTKIPGTIGYLENGVDFERPRARPRPGADLELMAGLEYEQRVAVAVGALLEDEKSDVLDWLKTATLNACQEKKAWESAQSGEAIAECPPMDIIPPNDEIRKALFKDSKLRLLMKTLGFERIERFDDDIDKNWVVPPLMSSEDLEKASLLLRQFTDNPPEFENGQTAGDQIRHKRAPTKRPASSDSDSGLDDFLDDERFKPSKVPKKRSKSRQVDGDELESRRQRRQKEQDDKIAAVKSSMFIHDSDEESDEERDRIFYEREAALRAELSKAAGGATPVMQSQAPMIIDTSMSMQSSQQEATQSQILASEPSPSSQEQVIESQDLSDETDDDIPVRNVSQRTTRQPFAIESEEE